MAFWLGDEVTGPGAGGAAPDAAGPEDAPDALVHAPGTDLECETPGEPAPPAAPDTEGVAANVDSGWRNCCFRC